jgi:hypothetical protein
VERSSVRDNAEESTQETLTLMEISQATIMAISQTTPLPDDQPGTAQKDHKQPGSGTPKEMGPAND